MTRAWFTLSVVAIALNAGCSSADDGLDTEASPSADTSDDEGTIAEQELRGGERLSSYEVASLIRQAGFPANMVGRMVCTAKWESSFYTKATNKNRNGSMDRGLFQIDSIHLGHTSNCPASSKAIFDPLTNTRCALAIYKMQGINAWYGYKAHRSECDRYRAPQRSMPGTDGVDQNDRHDLRGLHEPMSGADMYGEENASFGDRPEGSLDLPEPAVGAPEFGAPRSGARTDIQRALSHP